MSPEIQQRLEQETAVKSTQAPPLPFFARPAGPSSLLLPPLPFFPCSPALSLPQPPSFSSFFHRSDWRAVVCEQDGDGVSPARGLRQRADRPDGGQAGAARARRGPQDPRAHFPRHRPGRRQAARDRAAHDRHWRRCRRRIRCWQCCCSCVRRPALRVTPSLKPPKQMYSSARVYSQRKKKRSTGEHEQQRRARPHITERRGGKGGAGIGNTICTGPLLPARFRFLSVFFFTPC